MESNYILSIIVPSYNTSKYVDECLPTFIDERLFGKIKVLLIDDGATDDTAEKIKPYVEKYPFLFYFYHKENGGHGSVINYGVYRLVDTKYFKVVDGDDWINTDSMAFFINYLSNCEDDIVISDFKKIYPTKIEYVKCCKNNNVSNAVLNLDECVISIHSLTYKTDSYIKNKILLTEHIFYEDNEFATYPMLYAKSVSIVNKDIYQYRLGNPSQSVNVQNMIKKYKDLKTVRQKISLFYKKYINSCDNDSLKKYVAQLLANLYRNSFLIESISISDYKKARKSLQQLYREIDNFPLVTNIIRKHKIFLFIKSFNFRFVNFKRKFLIKYINEC